MVEFEQLEPWRGKNALILAVNSSLGVEIAEKLLKLKMFVIGVDNDENHIENLRLNKKFKFLKANLQEEEDILEVFQIVAINYGGAEMLVNIMKVTKSSSFLGEYQVNDFSDINICNQSQHRFHQILKRTVSILTKNLDHEMITKMDFVRISSISNVIENIEDKERRRSVSPSQYADAVQFVVSMPLHVQVKNVDLEAF